MNFVEVNASPPASIEFIVSLTIPVNSYFSIIPKIQYSFPLSSTARKRIEANSFNGQDSNFLYGGLIFDLKF